MKKSFQITVYNQESYTDYPRSASNNARRALEIRDEDDSKVSNCGTPVGWARANQLAGREPISRDTVARMASFNRHRQNSEGNPRENCGPLMWLAWGGTSGINWAINKMEELREAQNNAMQINFFGEVYGDYTLNRMEEILIENEGQDVEFLINSPGGDVFAGMAIASLIARRNARTTTTAIGVAASIASVILLAGDKVQMDERAFLMIHDAWAFSAGDAADLRKDARLLEKISNQLAEVYTRKIEANNKLIDGDRDKTKEQVRRMMKAETWLNADEAYKMGLIDEIVSGMTVTEEIEIEGGYKTDEEMEMEREEIEAGFYNRLKAFKNTPTKLLNNYKTCQDCQNKKAMENSKKSLWQAIKAFFGAEIKAEIEAQKEPEAAEEPTTIEDQNNEEMTIEEMRAALAAEGFEVSPKEEPKAEEPKEETTVDPLAAMQEELNKLKAELKDAKFKAASTPAGTNEPKAKKEEKTVSGLSKEQITVFDRLAEIAKTRK